MEEPLDRFGAFFVENLRDKMLDNLEMLLGGKWKAPAVQDLQKQLAQLSADERKMVRDLVERITTSGMHDLLFALQEQANAGTGVQVLVDGKNVAKLSDGLHGEIFGDKGWIVRYSKHPSAAELEGARWAKEQIQKMFGGQK